MTNNHWLWIGFNVFVLLMLALDLGVFHRKAHVVTFKESMAWTVVWITLALIFNFGVYHYMGPQKGLEFFTGYVIEKSLIANGVFAMSGLALVSSGKSPFEQRAKTGGAGAAAALIAPPWTES